MIPTTQPKLSPSQAKSILGFATHLSEQQMIKNAPPQAPQDAPGTTQTPEPDNQPMDAVNGRMDDMEAKFTAQIDDIKKMISAEGDDEVTKLKEEIKKALSETNG